MFSEDSSFPEQNGSDMKFNPTDQLWVGQSFSELNLGTADFSNFVDVSSEDMCLGGKHWIYVLNTPYCILFFFSLLA